MKRSGELDIEIEDGKYRFEGDITLENGKIKYIDNGNWKKYVKVSGDDDERNDYCKRCNKPLVVKTLDHCGCCLMFMKDKNDALLGEPVA